MRNDVYKRVILIGVDGAGAFFRQADTPELDRIFKDGAVSHHVLTAEPTISAQCWGSMLLGVKPEIHRLTNGIVDEVPYPVDSEFPSVFRVIRENDPDCEMASFSDWNPINYGIIENNLGVTKGTGFAEMICNQICDYVKDHDPKMVFLQFDNVDGAGHGHGYGTPKHLEEITKTEKYIKKIYDAYDARGFLDDTLFIVTADHGGYGHGHGGSTDEEKYVSFMVAGRTIRKSEIQDMEIRDTPAIILHALGLDDKKPSSWTAKIPFGIFPGVGESERPVYTIKYAYDYRVHDTVPTPASDILTILGADKVKVYLPFDGSAENRAAGIDPEAAGKLYYIDGFFGAGCAFDDGCLSLPGLKIGTQSVTVAFWLKTGGVAGDPAILSNKNWSNSRNSGIALVLRPLGVALNAGLNGEARVEEEHMLPLDFRNGWVYAVFVIDRENNRLMSSLDFGPFHATRMPDAFKDVSFDTDMTFRIGQDGTGEYDRHLSAVLDEFVIMDGVMPEEKLADLKEFYGV